MELHQLIVHELEKSPEATEANLFLSDASAPVDERATHLATRLNQAFAQRNDLLQGYLSSPEDALFPGYLQHLVEESLTATAFLEFSRDTMRALQLSLQGVVGAKGGYVVYLDYTAYTQRWVGIFLVRNTEGLVFHKDPSAHRLGLGAVTFLNTDKLALACRIGLDRYHQGGGRCVEVMKYAKSQKEISDYFVNWIGLEQPSTSRELTQSFLEMVETLPPPLDETTGETLAPEVFQEKAINFAVSNPARTINLRAFESEFYGDQPAVQDYLRERELSPDDEFHVDRSALRQHHFHRLAAEGLSLQFTRTHLRQGLVSIDGDQVVLHAPELAEQLRDLLADQ